MTDAPRLRVTAIDLFERDVRLRMPFRFGVTTLTEAPQVFVRARIHLADGRGSAGMAAELLAPKWFDKDLALSNEQNFDQLRAALAIARGLYLAAGSRTAFGLHAATWGEQLRLCAERRLNPLIASFGAALLDRAVLDALGRALGLSIFEMVQRNLPGIDASLTPDLEGFGLDRFLAGLAPAGSIEARHTVGMVDALTEAEIAPADRLGDGLPQSLEACIARYGVGAFKLKVGGDVAADLDRLCRIADVIDRGRPYRGTLDGNEQYSDAEAVVALWRAMEAEPRLQRLCRSILFIEQPIARAHALERPIGALAALRPVEIDESDATYDAFKVARGLGYTGVSSKSCKGFYRSLLNRARCAAWNAEAGEARFFMSAEDLTTQAGLAVQQDLALATLIGCEHVERNGHHYVNGMAGLPEAEQAAFLAAHPDLYHRADGVVRLTIRDGQIALGSLDTPGLASAVLPAVATMRPLAEPV
jgi:hypothetical protein